MAKDNALSPRSVTASPSSGARIAPMLATLGALPPDDGTWAFEVKWDGVRVIATVEDGRVSARGRSGRDVTVTYPELAALAGVVRDRLGATRAVLDGEVVVFDAAGRPDLGLLAHRMHVSDGAAARRLAARTPVTYLVFDILALAGRDTTGETYDTRRALLRPLPRLGDPADPGDRDPGDRIAVSEAFEGGGAALLRASADAGLEGVVAKRRASTYRPGRSPDWIKVKNVRDASVVIGGWEPGTGTRAGTIGALLVGVAIDPPPPSGPRFRYAGQVGTGFTDATLRLLSELLATLGRDTAPLADVPREYARDARWVEPVLIADVGFGAWTTDGRMRHPRFRGLRDDVEVDIDPTTPVGTEAPFGPAPEEIG